MKLNHSILLLSLCLAKTTFLSDASPLSPHPHNSNTESSLTSNQHPEFDPYQALNLNSPPNVPNQRRKRSTITNNHSNHTPSSQKKAQRKNNSKIEASSGKTENSRRSTIPVKSSSSSSSSSSSTQNIKDTKSSHKGALPPSYPNSATAPDAVADGTTSSKIPNSPLLILPDSRSVWQSGSYQTVQWSLKYTKTLPKDTTVDIILVDSKTNRKISSLRRFVPFKKGSTQVWVPVNLPEGISFVLVLELYRGRSQEKVTSTQHSSPEKPRDPPPTTTDVFSSVVRRSDISISSGANSNNNNIASDSNFPAASSGNSNGPSGGGAFGTSKSGAHHDINNDDYYTGSITERPFDFLPQEMREEYPNTVRPLELYHTFGLHQKVYTSTPYTLEWKIPERIKELLDYTHLIQASAASKNSNQRLQHKSVFLAKILVELVTDQTLESVAVLARDIPAETMFQYLSIQGHVPQAFYRLRVQMVVVQVDNNASSLNLGQQILPLHSKSKPAMEGWEFPEGGKVIDRYEAVTRRFWASQGAL